MFKMLKYHGLHGYHFKVSLMKQKVDNFTPSSNTKLEFCLENYYYYYDYHCYYSDILGSSIYNDS